MIKSQTSPSSFQDTLGNIDWLRSNESALKKLLPDTWTHIENLDGPRIGYRLKILGVDWRSEEDFGKIMFFLEKIGFMQRTMGFLVRANPTQVIT